MYMRKPLFFTILVVGKSQLDKMIARASHHMGSQGATITAGGGESPASPSREAGNSVMGKPSEMVGDSRVERSAQVQPREAKPFTRQTFATIWASGIVPPSIIDSEFLERLK